MLIKKISFMNYKKFKEPTELSLEDFSGRIGILGNNGSGKSSLLDVIPISLYGVEAVTGKKEHLRTQGVDKDMVKLRFEFIHNNREFIIEREFRGLNLTPKANLFEMVDGAVTLLATSAKDVTSYVEKILNMNYATFISTIFCKQKELDRLSGMDPAERRRFILKLSGVDTIEDEIKKCRELKRESDKYVKILMEEANSKQDVIKEIEQLDVEVKAMKDAHKNTLKKVAKCEKEFAVSDEAKKDMDLKYEQFNEISITGGEIKYKIEYLEKNKAILLKEKEEIESLQKYMDTEGNSILSSHQELVSKLEELDKIRLSYVQKQQKLSMLNKIKQDGVKAKSDAEDMLKQVESLNYNEDTLKNIGAEIVKIDDNINALREEKSKKDNEYKNCSLKIQECTQEISKIQKLHVSDSSESCNCPMCHQSVSSEHISIVENHYNSKISEWKEMQLSIQKEVGLLGQQLTELVGTLNSLKKTENDTRLAEQKYIEFCAKHKAADAQYKAKIAEYNATKAEYEEFANIEFDEKEYDALKREKLSYDEKVKSVYISADKIKKLPATLESIESVEKDLETNTVLITKLRADIVAIGFKKDDYIKAKSDYEKASLKLKNITDETKELYNQISMKDVTERKFLKDKLENAKKKEREYDKHRMLSQDYTKIEESLINTKNHMMAKINPLINKHLSDIFKTLINEKYDDIELDEQYNIFIYDCGVAFPLSRFSGGEQDLCNLALRLAISKFLAETNTGCIEFVVLDEIFASLDDDKKAALIEVLGNLHSFFKQIFVISHEDVIKSSLDHYLTVKENEYRYSEIEL